MNFLKWMDKTLLQILKVVTVTAFIGLMILVTGRILERFVPFIRMLWSEEIIELFFAYMVFFGAAALWMSREHFSAGDWIGRKVIGNERGRHFYRMLLELIGLAFVVLFCYYSYKLMTGTISVTNILAMPKWIFYTCMPISGLIMVIYSIRNIVVEWLAFVCPAQS